MLIFDVLTQLSDGMFDGIDIAGKIVDDWPGGTPPFVAVVQVVVGAIRTVRRSEERRVGKECRL